MQRPALLSLSEQSTEKITKLRASKLQSYNLGSVVSPAPVWHNDYLFHLLAPLIFIFAMV